MVVLKSVACFLLISSLANCNPISRNETHVQGLKFVETFYLLITGLRAYDLIYQILRAYPDGVKHAFTRLGGAGDGQWSDEKYATENGHITGIDIWYGNNNEVQAIRAR